MLLRPITLVLLVVSPLALGARDADWPRFRGPNGSGVATDPELPLHWSRDTHVIWSAPVPGEGASSPIVVRGRLYVTSAQDDGLERSVHALDAASGTLLWTRNIASDSPEVASSVTGHAAATPASDGEHLVSSFGNAGLFCHDARGALLWHHDLGEFETELGIAASPVIHRGRVLLVCDHDGDRFSSFDSYLLALDIETGEEAWKTPRSGVYRSWSTPIVVAEAGREELVVCAEEEMRGYDPQSGSLLWNVRGLTSWVAPSPVYDSGRIFMTSGKAGPILAVRPGGEGDVTATHVAWREERTGAYFISPVVYEGRLWVLRSNGVLTCHRAESGDLIFRGRLEGKFTASPIAGAKKVYFTAEDGTSWILRSADELSIEGRSSLDEYTVASPAVSEGRLFFRTETRIFCIGSERPTGAGDSAPESRPAAARATAWLAREVPLWPRKHSCHSCHHSGDGARALLAAESTREAGAGSGVEISKDALTGVIAWLSRPDEWSENEGAEGAEGAEFKDEKLARLQFAAALAAATESRRVTDRAPLEKAAELVGADQNPDGSWRGGSVNAVGSPAAWSRHLATFFGVEILRSAMRPADDESIDRARRWLASEAPRNVHEAAAILAALARDPEPVFGTRRSECLDAIRRGESPEGGWGPYVHSPPEAFDTALVLVALARLRESRAADEYGSEGSKRDALESSDDKERTDEKSAGARSGLDAEIERWIRRGRAFLASVQDSDGAWPATTRPPGGESYAQRTSTTAWALLALLATEEHRAGSSRRDERDRQ